MATGPPAVVDGCAVHGRLVLLRTRVVARLRLVGTHIGGRRHVLRRLALLHVSGVPTARAVT